MNKKDILVNKDGLTFYKLRENEYCTTCSLTNTHLKMSEIINFDLIKLIYDINTDIYEKTYIDKIDNDNAILTLVLKPFFKDLGLPQRYSILKIKRTVNNENKIIFICETDKDINKDINKKTYIDVPANAELLDINNINIDCTILSSDCIDFKITILFDKNMIIPSFVEKTISIITHKIFIRVKQFIENIRM